MSKDEVMLPIWHITLFQLYLASLEWCLDHYDDANRPYVMAACQEAEKLLNSDGPTAA